LIDGQISLKKGEAFRVFVPVSYLFLNKKAIEATKRVEVHIRTPKAEKDK
jgi:hypothetical protein